MEHLGLVPLGDGVDGADVYELLDARRLGAFEHVDRTAHVHAVRRGRVLVGDLHDARAVQHDRLRPFGKGEKFVQRLGFCDVSEADLNAQLPHERTVLSGQEQRAHRLPPFL